MPEAINPKWIDKEPAWDIDLGSGIIICDVKSSTLLRYDNDTYQTIVTKRNVDSFAKAEHKVKLIYDYQHTDDNVCNIIKTCEDCENIESVKKENEALKCCGNCRHMETKMVWDNLEYYCKLDMIDIDEFETSKYCDRWEYDGLTREERMTK